MNRWQGWAARLRHQHARVGVQHAAGPMVLLRAAGASPLAVRMQARTIVHLHARWQVAPHLAFTFGRAASAPAVLRLATPDTQARDLAPVVAPAVADDAPRAAPPMVLASRAPAPAFAPAAPSRGSGMVLSRRTIAILSPVRRSVVESPAGVHAAEIAARVRRDASRQEAPRAAPAAVLAKSRAVPSGAVAAEPAPSTRAPLMHDAIEQAARLQAPAAFNVEALTGLVIQQIDRRLVAYRERMGGA